MRRPSRSYRWKRTSLGCVAGYSRTGIVTSPNDRVPVHTAVAMSQGYREAPCGGRAVPGVACPCGPRSGRFRDHLSTRDEEHPIEHPAAEPTSALSEIRHDLVVSARALVASFRNPDLARAQLALVAFSICEWASFIALMVFAFEQGGAAAIGIISLVQLIPAAVIAPLGPVLGDRFPRERGFMLAEASMSAACVLAAVAALLEAPSILIYAAACTVGWLLTLVRPTHGALLPWLARDPTELTTAYSWRAESGNHRATPRTGRGWPGSRPSWPPAACGRPRRAPDAIGRGSGRPGSPRSPRPPCLPRAPRPGS